MISLAREEVAEKLAEFIWNFKVGDNVAYNFRVLYTLYEQKRQLKEKDRYTLNKPIAVTVVSIIEALFYDLICRLGEATTHFPESISQHTRVLIKNKIDKEKEWFIYKDGSGKENRYKRIKNYSFKDIIVFLKKYKLLGNEKLPIYSHLTIAAYLRNRIHIFNWFGNFEKSEVLVFDEARINKLEDLLVEIIDIMVREYSRPFKSGLRDGWFQAMSQ